MKHIYLSIATAALTVAFTLTVCADADKQKPEASEAPQRTAESTNAANDSKWPDNEYTRALGQKPEGTITTAAIQDMGTFKVFAVEVSGTAEQAKAYAAALKKAGFKAGELERPSEVLNASKGGYKVKVGAYSTGDSWYIQVVKEQP